jgi:hypothetical protein
MKRSCRCRGEKTGRFLGSNGPRQAEREAKEIDEACAAAKKDVAKFFASLEFRLPMEINGSKKH